MMVQADLALLLKQLNGRTAFDRAAAAEELGAIGDPAAIKPLERSLRDKSAEVRHRAVEALGLIPGAAPGPIARLLLDPDELVRASAAESLGLLGRSTCGPSLRRALKDTSPLVRSYAAAALGKVDGNGAKGALRRALSREKSDEAKLGFYEGLWLAGDKEGVLQCALSLLDSDDYRVRSATSKAFALTFIAPESIKSITRVLRRRLETEPIAAVRAAVTATLRRIAEQHARSPNG